MAEYESLGGPTQARIDRFIMGIILLAQAQSARIESHMKANAPWRDRTTNARNGLYSTTRIERFGGWGVGGPRPGVVRIIVDSGHQVAYGVYLEKNNGGRWAIVQPTLDFFGPQLLSQIRGLKL